MKSIHQPPPPTTLGIAAFRDTKGTHLASDIKNYRSTNELLYSKTPNNPRNLKIHIKQELGLFYG